MKSRGFTLQSNSRFLAIETRGAICEAYQPDNSTPHPEVFDITMVWDTGSIKTVISQRLASLMHLYPFGKNLTYNSHGPIELPLYKVNLILPNGIEVYNLTVQCDMLPCVDVLVGMDVISMTDFSITNNGTIFSFQIPSTHHHDYQLECAE